MPEPAPFPQRKKLRLKDFDYSTPGAYFVTICAQGRRCLLGDVKDGRVVLSGAGEMVCALWEEVPHKFPSVKLDQYVVMPNHLHGILVLVGADLCVRPGLSLPPRLSQDHAKNQTSGGHMGPPLQRIVQWFKTMSTNRYIAGVRTNGWTPFAGKLWQRGYYERVVRDEDELNDVRRYIENNPLRWEMDEENPSARGRGGRRLEKITFEVLHEAGR